MKKILSVAASAMLLLGGCAAYNQQPRPSAQDRSGSPVAGQTPLGVTVTEMTAVVSGWSAKRSILNKPVFNEQNQRIGTIDDIIVTPNDAVSFAIVGTGGFLGVNKHDVAIPVDQIDFQNGQFVLPGATKEALKALPEFEYAARR